MLTSVTFAKLATPIHTQQVIISIFDHEQYSTIWDDLVTRKIIKIPQVNLTA